MAELSNRMQAVANLVPKGHIAADVGCDHGFVSIYLIENQICPHVYAADLRPGPLERAKEHIAQAGLKDRITAVLSDGLTNVPVACGKEPGADVMVAAGIGGKLTVSILSAFPEKTENLSYVVLEPQSEVWLVRRWLLENDFKITDEDMVLEDGKYYPIILAENQRGEMIAAKQEQNVKKADAAIQILTTQSEAIPRGFTADSWQKACDQFGRLLIQKKSPVLISYLTHMIEADKKLLEQMPVRNINTVRQADRADYNAEKLSGSELRIRQRTAELKARISLAEAVVNLMENGEN